MADEPKKARGGSRLARSEITTVRLDPKLRYLAELAARKQRRTLSSFVEWAIEDTLDRLPIREWGQGAITFRDRAEDLWDVDEADRFAKLAFLFPELMTHEEQIIWKLVCENGYLWRGRYSKATHEWEWNVEQGGLLLDRLREHWAAFKAVASQEQPATELPTWTKLDPKRPKTFEDMDDDIPF
ncbi:hypothetical protein [uncultured Pseudacidovorax sp.]|uniref:hypothetical protein n=1 Tax=uncultured Pseudacidovorax sp. TaxID=679313 RepID=UPI0025D51704|nr:hypothetical protein [uncultured Pseudacidovorax sp.]